jgi:hypothetical protein
MQSAPARILLLGTDNMDGSGTVTGTTGSGNAANPTTSKPVTIQNQGIGTFYFRGIGTTSGGTILVEEADWGPQEQPYTGTWSLVTTVAASSITGNQQFAYHPPNACYGWIRVRISSAITGGGSVYVSLQVQSAG